MRLKVGRAVSLLGGLLLLAGFLLVVLPRLFDRDAVALPHGSQVRTGQGHAHTDPHTKHTHVLSLLLSFTLLLVASSSLTQSTHTHTRHTHTHTHTKH